MGRWQCAPPLQIYLAVYPCTFRELWKCVIVLQSYSIEIKPHLLICSFINLGQRKECLYYSLSPTNYIIISIIIRISSGLAQCFRSFFTIKVQYKSKWALSHTPNDTAVHFNMMNVQKSTSVIAKLIVFFCLFDFFFDFFYYRMKLMIWILKQMNKILRLISLYPSMDQVAYWFSINKLKEDEDVENSSNNRWNQERI